MGALTISTPVPLDFALSTGKVLAVRDCPGGGYYVRIDGGNIAKVDTLRAARQLFFALVCHDTAEAEA